jgi:hypothetical protein
LVCSAGAILHIFAAVLFALKVGYQPAELPKRVVDFFAANVCERQMRTHRPN